MNQEQTKQKPASIPLVVNTKFARLIHAFDKGTGTFTQDQWSAFLAAWERGEQVEISESVYWYFLEVLPPVSMSVTVDTVSGNKICADFLQAEGVERITAFWTRGDRYFLQHTWMVNRG